MNLLYIQSHRIKASVKQRPHIAKRNHPFHIIQCLFYRVCPEEDPGKIHQRKGYCSLCKTISKRRCFGMAISVYFPDYRSKFFFKDLINSINLPFISMNANGPLHFDMDLSRAKFDELTSDLVERTAIPVQNALKDAGITASELGKVLLVGGSTRIPAVQDKVKQLTGHEPSKSLNPDECVALGASIQGGKLAGDAGAGDILLLDVTPLSLSIETMGGIGSQMISFSIGPPSFTVI